MMTYFVDSFGLHSKLVVVVNWLRLVMKTSLMENKFVVVKELENLMLSVSGMVA